MRYALALSLLLGATAIAEQACPEPPSNGAREGEDLDARIERLERELRLSKAEKAVREQRKGRRR